MAKTTKTKPTKSNAGADEAIKILEAEKKKGVKGLETRINELKKLL